MAENVENSRPEKTFRAGHLSASIFRNTITVGDEQRVIPKVVFQKRYLKSEGNWATTGSLDVHELPKAVLVLEKAYAYLVSRETGTEDTEQARRRQNHEKGEVEEPEEETGTW